MDKVNTFTSTGHKFLRQVLNSPSLLYVPKPVSLQVALTERCNLNCAFCSVVNRENKYELGIAELAEATLLFKNLGVKTVEITGGGEPTLYAAFEYYVKFCKMIGLEVGLITNGTLLHKVNPEVLNTLSWLRISMNCLDYDYTVEVPKIRGTVGFSYVMGPDSTEERLRHIVEMARVNNVSYVRVVPNCLCSASELELQHWVLTHLVNEIGPPAFYQQKNFGTSKTCHWCRYKPFLYCDGNVYPCSSVVLNPDANKNFDQSYAICHWKDVPSKMYMSNLSLVDTTRCEHCVFTGQNNMIESLLTTIEHPNFI